MSKTTTAFSRNPSFLSKRWIRFLQNYPVSIERLNQTQSAPPFPSSSTSSSSSSSFFPSSSSSSPSFSCSSSLTNDGEKAVAAQGRKEEEGDQGPVGWHSLPVYIIHLCSDLVREEYIRKAVAKSNAAHALLITVQPISDDIVARIHTLFPETSGVLTRGEMGCALSHLWCLWHATCERKHRYFCVLEDDVCFARHFDTAFSSFFRRNLAHLQQGGLWMLGASDIHYARNIHTARTGGNRNEGYIPTYPPLGAFANLYSAAFAEDWLRFKTSHFGRFDENYDGFLPRILISDPPLLLCDLSTSSLNHHYFPFFSVTPFHHKCFSHIGLQHYHYMLLDYLDFLSSSSFSSSFSDEEKEKEKEEKEKKEFPCRRSFSQYCKHRRMSDVQQASLWAICEQPTWFHSLDWQEMIATLRVQKKNLKTT